MVQFLLILALFSPNLWASPKPNISLTKPSKQKPFDPPNDIGSYPITIRKQSITLASRSVELIVYRPFPDKIKSPPIVVLLHAFAAEGVNYTAYGDYLASHGFLVIIPSIKSNVMQSLTHVQLAQIQVQLHNWIETSVKDKFSLIFEANSDLLAVGGHSRGGKIAIYTATMDSRIKASFNLDPVDSGNPFKNDPEAYPSTTPEMMHRLTIPVGYVGGGHSHKGKMGISCAPLEDNFHQFYMHSKKPAYEYIIKEAGHHDFMDECNLTCKFTCTEGKNKNFTKWISKTLMVAFYKTYLAGDQRYEVWLHSKLAPYKHLMIMSRKV